MKLHNAIKNIYEKCLKPLFSIEVLGNDNKWKRITSLNITDKQQFFEVKTATCNLKCTANHILIDDKNNEILAIQSIGKKIQTQNGIETVIQVKKTNVFDNAYDLSLDESTDHLYYCNKLLSHNCVILDEFAFLQKNIADKLFTSMYPVISSSKNGKFIIVSTPNGTDNLYYDIWCQANSKEIGKNLEGWKPFEMHWFDVPGHDELWKQKQIAAIGAQRFAQEFDNQFLAKGNDKKLIPDDVLQKYRIKLSEYKSKGIQPKKQKIVSPNEDQLYEFDMWHEFDPKRTYLASADISEGIGGDNSVLYIWDVTDLSNVVMCAKFSSNTTSLVQFAYVTSKMLALYNSPWLAAERNGVSAGMLDSLRITYGYQNIVVDNKKREPGIYSHVTVKERACLWTREMMTTSCFGFTLYDKDLIDELSLFIKKDSLGQRNIYHAMPGPNSHDDHVMALIWGLYVLHNDRVNDYFIVADTFTTQINQTYAHILMPLNEYTQASIDLISKDPLYKEFMEHKIDAMKRSKEMFAAIKKEDDADIFQYETVDPYFGDSDSGSWNDTPLDWNMKPGFQQGRPQSIQLGGSRGAPMPSFVVI